MQFIKFHGYGNDYIVCEATQLTPVGSLNDFVRRACDRHYGIGADGVALIEAIGEMEENSSSPAGDVGADFTVRIFNHDGSEAAMSGNGTRCAASYLYYQKLWTRDELRLKTRAGVKLYRLRAQLGPGHYRFEAEIGQPLFASAAIPMLTDEPVSFVKNYPLSLDAGDAGEIVEVTALQMCNPNCCVFTDDFATSDWRRIGRAIETHRQFPERTNVEFVRVRARDEIEARVWERGVGETLSSGTGACASAVASIVNGLTDRRVRVLMPGGQLEVAWREDDEVLLTGEAEIIYRGEWKKENIAG